MACVFGRWDGTTTVVFYESVFIGRNTLYCWRTCFYYSIIQRLTMTREDSQLCFWMSTCSPKSTILVLYFYFRRCTVCKQTDLRHWLVETSWKCRYCTVQYVCMLSHAIDGLKTKNSKNTKNENQQTVSFHGSIDTLSPSTLPNCIQNQTF